MHNFSPLQLDVFRALSELYRPPRHRARPAAKSRNSKCLAVNRAHASLEVPIRTVAWRDLTDRQGRIQRCRTEVYDYKTPYSRVRYADRDWDEMTPTKTEQGRNTSSASTKSASRSPSKRVTRVSSKTDLQTFLENIQTLPPMDDACRLFGIGTVSSWTPSVGGVLRPGGLPGLVLVGLLDPWVSTGVIRTATQGIGFCRLNVSQDVGGVTEVRGKSQTIY